MDILALKNVILQIRTFVDGFNWKLATTEERISELKVKSEENIQNKERQRNGKYERVSLIQDTMRSSKVCLFEPPKERKREWARSII